jgi:predicted amidohydrolase YtcJ
VSQALAVKDGRIVEIGGTDEILWLREDDYELIDLQGCTIVPGVTDSTQGFSIQGTLGAGQNADFLVLSGDPLEARPEGSEDIRVVEAWVGGRRILVRP